MKFKPKQPIKLVKKDKFKMINKHENIEDSNRIHEYFLKMSLLRELDYAN